MKHGLLATALALGLQASPLSAQQAAESDSLERYTIDTRGAHAFVQFRIPHLGYSWLYGRFNDFEGEFTFDPANPSNSSVDVTIQTTSIDSNHERRDNHLRGKDFLSVDAYPRAHFRSTSFTPKGDEQFTLVGNLTLMGQTREVEIDVEHFGAGDDPWGGFRRGFTGKTALTLTDFGIDYNLGEDSRVVEMILDIEGIRQD
ncbi:MAG: YceI family protein [Pseudomonadota bacterium]